MGSVAWRALGSSIQCPESKSTKDQILLFHPACASLSKGTGRRKEDQRGISRQRQAVGKTGMTLTSQPLPGLDCLARPPLPLGALEGGAGRRPTPEVTTAGSDQVLEH